MNNDIESPYESGVDTEYEDQDELEHNAPDLELNAPDLEIENGPDQIAPEVEDIETPEPDETKDDDEDEKPEEPKGPVFTPPSFGGMSLQD